jgi:hypothetical protein
MQTKLRVEDESWLFLQDCHENQNLGTSKAHNILDPSFETTFNLHSTSTVKGSTQNINTVQYVSFSSSLGCVLLPCYSPILPLLIQSSILLYTTELYVSSKH